MRVPSLKTLLFSIGLLTQLGSTTAFCADYERLELTKADAVGYTKDEALMNLASRILRQSETYKDVVVDRLHGPRLHKQTKHSVIATHQYETYLMRASDEEDTYSVLIRISPQTERVFLNSKRTKTGIRVFGVGKLGDWNRALLTLHNGEEDTILRVTLAQ